MKFKNYIEALEGDHIENEFKKFETAFDSFEKIIILGNGGSNAIASHISQDYVKFKNKRSLVFSDPSMLTCFINDFGMENANVKFLESYCTSDTLCILISSGGESKNILNCIEWCENNNVSYGILTGFDHSNTARKISTKSLFDFHVNSKNYGIVECTHQIFLHRVI